MANALAGKAAIVFGGSRGIGAGVAKCLASSGADVALTFVSQQQQAAALVSDIEGCGRRGIALAADSANRAQIHGAVRATVERFGRLDVAVVNAGIVSLASIDRVEVTDLDRCLAVNLRGVFLAIQAAQAEMREGGRIVTIGSVSGVKAFAGASVYSMTKAGVAMLVKCAALDLAPRGITVNNVQPGPIKTDMTSGILDQLQQTVPLGALGTPADVGSLVAYLAGDEARFITGASISIDGGISL